MRRDHIPHRATMSDMMFSLLLLPEVTGPTGGQLEDRRVADYLA